MSDRDFEAFLKGQQVTDHPVTILLKPLEGEVQFLKTVLKPVDLVIDKFAEYVKPTGGQFVSWEDVAKHGAILVFGYLYEYNEEGIHRKSANVASGFPEKHVGGNTKKTREEFQEWVMSVGNEFSAEKYMAGSNNCLHFVKAACGFLGVPVGSRLQIILEWLKQKGAKLVDSAQSSCRSSARSSAQSANSCQTH